MSASQKKKMKFSQKKVKYYSKSQHQQHQYLAPGMVGFLATCNFREKDCVREAYNVLRAAADDLYGPEHGPEEPTKDTDNQTTHDENNETCDDIADQLEKEANACKTAAKRPRYQRFQRVDTAVNNCIFVQTTLDDPVKLATKIVEEIKSTRLQKTRFLLRLIPIEAVCRVDDMDSTAGKLFDKYFLKEASSFSIVFNRRYNNDVKRDEIIAQLADLVASKNTANRVDLKNPDKTVIVEIVKGLCLLSVIPGYIQSKKFNLVELAAGVKEQTAAADKSADGAEKEQKDEDAAKTDEKT